jgi:hypothetical protein
MNKKIMISDFDGTLCDSSCQVNEEILQMFRDLQKQNIIRVIATGRSLYSAYKVLENDFPIDYLIFSSGAGLMNWKTKQIIFSACLSSNDTAIIASALNKKQIDYMIHHPIPDNHYFDYFLFNKCNTDFISRLKHYSDYARKADTLTYTHKKASQFLAITSYQANHEIFLSQTLDQFSVIRATSPLDHQSKWIEIFPKHISKSQTANYLCNLLSINQANSMAIGNDFNDLDLLEWAEYAFVVHNAHEDIKKQFHKVSSCHENGIIEAVSHWLNQT